MIMLNHRIVDMVNPFRLAGGAGSIMQNHPVLEIDPFNFRLRRSLLQFGQKIDNSFLLRDFTAHEEDMPQGRKLFAFHSGEQCRRSNDSYCAAIFQAILDRCLHERFKERSNNSPYLQCSQHTDVKLWTSRHKYKHTVTFADPVTAKHVGKLVSQSLQLSIRVGFVPGRITE
ncbi:hypothetical protein D3C77_352020 [compost metagenome]